MTAAAMYLIRKSFVSAVPFQPGGRENRLIGLSGRAYERESFIPIDGGAFKRHPAVTSSPRLHLKSPARTMGFVSLLERTGRRWIQAVCFAAAGGKARRAE